MSELEITRFKAPPVVSKRNEFSPADELVADGLMRMPEKYADEQFREWLLKYTENVIRRISHNFAVAAHRGIEQAATLLCDPEFYATRRQRRANWKKAAEEQRAAQEWERMERRNCPTAEQIKQDITRIEKWLADDEIQAARYRARLAELKAMQPKNIRLIPKSVKPV